MFIVEEKERNGIILIVGELCKLLCYDVNILSRGNFGATELRLILTDI